MGIFHICLHNCLARKLVETWASSLVSPHQHRHHGTGIEITNKLFGFPAKPSACWHSCHTENIRSYCANYSEYASSMWLPRTHVVMLFNHLTHRLTSCVRFCTSVLDESSWPSRVHTCATLACSSWDRRSLTRASPCACSRTPTSSLWAAPSSTRTSSYWNRVKTTDSKHIQFIHYDLTYRWIVTSGLPFILFMEYLCTLMYICNSVPGSSCNVTQLKVTLMYGIVGK